MEKINGQLLGVYFSVFDQGHFMQRFLFLDQQREIRLSRIVFFFFK